MSDTSATPVTPATPVTSHRRTHRLAPAQDADESGQTTAEYALLTGAIALLVAAVTAWATSTGKVGRLLDAVFNYLTKAIS